MTAAPHTYTTQYSGDANYALLNFGSVTMLDTTTALLPSASQVVYGNSVSLTASVSAAQGIPAGAVTLQDGATVLGTAPLDASGSASFPHFVAGRQSFVHCKLLRRRHI
ncbi:MAG TPA: Ig-like domain-containing protein [Candidatus Angelobacter sp.]|nr:Ig-like domain-containing protein [Candidatus Angelobacter sp.]